MCLGAVLTLCAVGLLVACGTALTEPNGGAAAGGPVRGGVGENQPTAADGFFPDGDEPSAFDNTSPTVTRLDPELLAALRTASTGARQDGIDVRVDSGWRSPRMQEWLLANAISEYGSRAEARRWVDTPTASQHVLGRAVDVGPPGAAAWFSEHAVSYDLCQIYANEDWHYELRPGASRAGCPSMYTDAAHDPRGQR